MKELQSDILIVILPAKSSSIVILTCEDYLEEFMDHINNGPCQLLKKDPATEFKAKALRKSKVLKDNAFIDNKTKLTYLKPTESPAPRFYGQSKMHKPIRCIVSYSDSPLYNLNKYIAKIVKHENGNAKKSVTFFNYIKNVPIKDDGIMALFEVICLCTNILIIDTLNIIKIMLIMIINLKEKWLYLKISFLI